MSYCKSYYFGFSSNNQIKRKLKYEEKIDFNNLNKKQAWFIKKLL